MKEREGEGERELEMERKREGGERGEVREMEGGREREMEGGRERERELEGDDRSVEQAGVVWGWRNEMYGCKTIKKRGEQRGEGSISWTNLITVDED